MSDYVYKGKAYRVKSVVKLKHPYTREWMNAVLYYKWGEPEEYVREENEFFSKFKRVGTDTECIRDN